MASRKPTTTTIVVHMGADDWSAKVRGKDGRWHHWDFRKMAKKDKSAFHRDLMNYFRSTRS